MQEVFASYGITFKDVPPLEGIPRIHGVTADGQTAIEALGSEGVLGMALVGGLPASDLSVVKRNTEIATRILGAMLPKWKESASWLANVVKASKQAHTLPADSVTWALYRDGLAVAFTFHRRTAQIVLHVGYQSE